MNYPATQTVGSDLIRGCWKPSVMLLSASSTPVIIWEERLRDLHSSCKSDSCTDRCQLFHVNTPQRQTDSFLVCISSGILYFQLIQRVPSINFTSLCVMLKWLILKYICTLYNNFMSLCWWRLFIGKNTTADLLLGINEFVGSLHCRVKDGQWCPHFDLQQAHVDPEHPRPGQLLRALDFVLNILFYACNADFYQFFWKDVGGHKFFQDGLDLLGCYQRVRILHKTLTTFHVAFL